MPDRAPLTSAHFLVDWGGPPGSDGFLRVAFAAFASIAPGQADIPAIPGISGGLASHPALTAAPARELVGQVVLTRMFTGDPALASWARDGGARDVLVTILCPDATPASRIRLTKAVPADWTLSPLDSLSSALLSESVTLRVGALAFVKHA